MNDEDNVVTLDTPTTLDIPAERVLDGAKEAELRCVIVLGHKEDGELYFASSLGGVAEVLWLLEKAKHNLLDFDE